MPNPLDPIWDAHVTTRAALKVVRRSMTVAGIDRARACSNSRFDGLADQQCIELLDAAQTEVDDSVVLSLYATFEATLRDHVVQQAHYLRDVQQPPVRRPGLEKETAACLAVVGADHATIRPSSISTTWSSGLNEPAIVGDDDQGATALLLLLAQECEDFVAPLVIEVARRLVGEQHLRVLDQGPRDGHALLLSTGKLRGLVLEPVAQPDLAENLFGLGVTVGVRPCGMNGSSTLSTADRL